MSADVQFYAYTPPTLPAPETTPFLQAFKQPDNNVRISVRGRNGAHAEIVLSVEEALRLSMHLGAAKFAHEVVTARAEQRAATMMNLDAETLRRHYSHGSPIGREIIERIGDE